MADNSTIFSVENLPTGWFSPETQGQGWFDEESLDPAAAGGGSDINASLSATEGADTLSASGTVPINGTASITEGADTAAATGAVALQASAALTEGADTLSASGIGGTGITGSLSATEDADTLSAIGIHVSAEQPTGGFGSYNFLNPRRYEPERQDDAPQQTKRKRKRKKPEPLPFQPIEIPPLPVIGPFGITINPDMHTRLQQMQAIADRATAERLHRIALADDDWLMMT